MPEPHDGVALQVRALERVLVVALRERQPLEDAANPTLTIAAVTLRQAARLIQELKP